ncbi:DNA primase [Synechococcus sp. RSCCF101]|uniref:DNA primase n=1 Tax=Synechococcus sp. RSCCF101 TaxID=2511069 RepID=UPI001243AADE|nr:DNA primase [Synechococcus sp. RSCCF101]QEY31505.1 DNA primase [Synechococcus sp. RSCCF101]
MGQPRLHPRTIEAVKDRADIVDVVGDHVVLQKKGREFVGICPFHDDSKPSMTVSPAKQFYYCFSCGAGGNAIKFLMEFQRQNFSEVVLDLARRYQVPVETVEGPQQERLRQQLSRREQLHRVLDLASGWFRQQLQSEAGRGALGYLRDTRGLSAATIERFQLGYAPERWDGLLDHLQRVERIRPELLEAAGLVVARKGGNGFYDRFRHRVMVPIRNRQGRVIAFGGRSLDGGEPKYLNSPETELFEKGRHLFGLDLAASAIRKADRAVVVEGYFDVIALHAAGIENAVAALGTALNAGQITQLCRCCESKRIVLNFDADGAGVRAAQRAIGEVEQLALQGQLQLRVLHLPSGKDPDEFLKERTPEAYRALLDQAPLWLDWQIETILEGKDLRRADQFQQAVADLVTLLGRLPASAVRSHYLQQVAERLSGGQARLALQLEQDLRQQVKGQRWHGRSQRFDQPGEAGQRERAEALILRLYLHHPRLRGTIRHELHQRDLENFALQHHRRLWASLSELEEERLGVEALQAISRGQGSDDLLAEFDLAAALSDQLLSDDPALLDRLQGLLLPSDLDRLALAEPLLSLQGATASLERQRSLRRCRHLLEAWSSRRLQTLETCLAQLLEQQDPSARSDGAMEDQVEHLFRDLNQDVLSFQELYYSERRHIGHLDRQRCAGFSRLPGGGEPVPAQEPAAAAS